MVNMLNNPFSCITLILLALIADTREKELGADYCAFALAVLKSINGFLSHPHPSPNLALVLAVL